jgi:hypothetical protein
MLKEQQAIDSTSLRACKNNGTQNKPPNVQQHFSGWHWAQQAQLASCWYFLFIGIEHKVLIASDGTACKMHVLNCMGLLKCTVTSFERTQVLTVPSATCISYAYHQRPKEPLLKQKVEMLQRSLKQTRARMSTTGPGRSRWCPLPSNNGIQQIQVEDWQRCLDSGLWRNNHQAE